MTEKCIHTDRFNHSVIVGFFILLTSVMTGIGTIVVHDAGATVSNSLGWYTPRVERAFPMRRLPNEPDHGIPVASNP